MKPGERVIALSDAIDLLQEYSGKLWKEGQQDRSIRVGQAAGKLAEVRGGL